MGPELLFFGLVVAAVGVLAVVNVAGPKLAEPTELNDDGVVCTTNDAGDLEPADPVALARGAGLDPNAYALARVIVSEAGNQRIAKEGVAWTVLNHCRDAGKSVLAVVTRAALNHGKDDGAGDGYFGRQGDSSGGYRYVSSAQDSTDESREIAVGVFAGDVEDPTGGAVNFDSPHGYSDPAKADAFAAARQKEGKELVTLNGVPESTLRFWRPA